jgi:hypothetical protein
LVHDVRAELVEMLRQLLGRYATFLLRSRASGRGQRHWAVVVRQVPAENKLQPPRAWCDLARTDGCRQRKHLHPSAAICRSYKCCASSATVFRDSPILSDCPPHRLHLPPTGLGADV